MEPLSFVLDSKKVVVELWAEIAKGTCRKRPGYLSASLANAERCFKVGSTATALAPYRSIIATENSAS